MDTSTSARRLDLRGKTISTYVVFEVMSALRDLSEGDVLEFITDDFEPFESDMAAWATAAGHWLVSKERVAEGLLFEVKKGAPVKTDASFAMVISDDGLLEMLSPLAFALAAALEGMAVSLYFQGPGVRALTKGHRPHLKGFGRPFTRFAAAGMSKTGHIPAQEKLRQLRELGAEIYVCGGSMQPFKVKKEDLIFDDLPIVEYMTFVAVMKEADIQLYM